MWWRLGVLAAVAIAPLLLLIMPIPTVDIVVVLPPARGGGSMSGDEMGAVLTGVATAITVLLLLGYLALVLWIGRGIVRKHGRRA